MYSIAHSEKGWTDKIIGRLWIEDFEKKTRTKANRWTRLLLVDGHNSHYTKEFLDYAREHDIQILCYPAHATHIYQGLDVIVFRPLKQYWTQERDKFEAETGQKINKTNFVSVYLQANHHALTPETIQSAFWVTGVWPFNLSVVTKDKMAPSLETSKEGHLSLPQPSPVCVVSAAIHRYKIEQLEASNITLTHSESRQAAQETCEALAETSAAFLVQDTWLTSNDHLLSKTHLISPWARSDKFQQLSQYIVINKFHLGKTISLQ